MGLCTHTHGSLNIKNKINRSITIFLFLITFVILNTENSKAVLQANGNESTKYNLSDWMLNVRKMEEVGGAMGLTETLNSDLTSSTSNNIDVHMEKNTEYGALVILSASSYGNSNKINSGETTTGNATGVVMNIGSEWVVASVSSSKATNFLASAARYKNVYDESYVVKKGDAIKETYRWHGSENSYWLDSVYAGLIRNYSGGIFSYWGNAGYDGSQAAGYAKKYSTRAVVVSGKGL